MSIYSGNEPRMPWEVAAEDTVERIVLEAEYDDFFRTVTLPPNGDLDHRRGEVCSDLEEVEDYLISVFDEEWCANVAFEGGEAVFEADARGFVSDLMTVHTGIVEFFEQIAEPDDASPIVTADQLLQSPNASNVIRVTLEEVNEELVRYLAEDPRRMRDLAPRKFEEFVAEMFRSKGYEVELTPRTRDGGIDITAIRRDDTGGTMLIIECKRYAENRAVGVEVVRGLYGVLEEKRATKGIIAATSYFSRDAKAFRQRIPYRLELSDFHELTRQINDWKRRLDK